MSEPVQKRVDESWKEQAEKEKKQASVVRAPGEPQVAGPQQSRPKQPAAQQPPEADAADQPLPDAPGEDQIQARFDTFVSSLAMEALIALGEVPHPVTRRQSVSLPHAKYLIDILGILQEKTRGNLVPEEDALLKDTLYQLRLRYLSRAGRRPAANPMIALCSFIAAIVAGAAAWFIRGLMAEKRAAQSNQAAETRAASAEAVAAELRPRLEDMDETILALRGKLTEEQELRTRAETQYAELCKAQAQLSESFQALADAALKNNNASFLELAKEKLDNYLAQAGGDLDLRKQAIQGLVEPLQTAVDRLATHVNTVNKDHAEAYGTLKANIEALAEQEKELGLQTQQIVSALRDPKAKGTWGEMTLRRVVELAGMSEHCDFVEQHSIQAETGRLQPDLIVHLPGGRDIIVDAKTSNDAHYAAAALSDEESRQELLQQHARHVREHMLELASKAYWDQLPESLDFVVMFIPGESFMGDALRLDRNLLDDAMSKRVVLASPATLIALLRAVAYGWRQEQMAKNAQCVADLGKDLYDRFVTCLGHVVALEKNLKRSVESFNGMVGSIESRVLPGLRRFPELGVTDKDQVPSLNPVQDTPRQILADEARQEAFEA